MQSEPWSFRRGILPVIAPPWIVWIALQSCALAQGGDPQDPSIPPANPTETRDADVANPVPPHPSDNEVHPADVDRTLRALVLSRDEKASALAEAQAALSETADPAERATLSKRSEGLRAEIAELRWKFEAIASGIDVSGFQNDTSTTGFQLQKEIEGLLEPLIHQLKEATEGPRRIDELKTRIESLSQLHATAAEAAKRTDRKIPGADGEIRSALVDAKIAWVARRDDLQRQRDIAQFELQSMLADQRDPIEVVRSFAGRFFGTRGLNLLIAITAFVAAFLAMRLLHHRLLRQFLFKRLGSFSARLTNVILHTLSIVVAITAMLLALASVNDWVLMLVVILFLLGVGWASIQVLPQRLEEGRLLLNIGSVREGERLILHGLPWRIEQLMLYTRLSNPELSGGELRVPLRDLIGLRSRPVADKERWFPCREGDHVILDDGVRGKVDVQSPDMVHLRLPGGGTKSYPTPAFLALHPRNLSDGFRIEIEFSLDYRHQAHVTKEIPAALTKRLSEGLVAMVGEAPIVRVDVEFTEASTSSLKLEAQGDFDGSIASQYERLQHAMGQLLLQAATDLEYTIPFPQLVIHRPEDAAGA